MMKTTLRNRLFGLGVGAAIFASLVSLSLYQPIEHATAQPVQTGSVTIAGGTITLGAGSAQVGLIKPTDTAGNPVNTPVNTYNGTGSGTWPDATIGLCDDAGPTAITENSFGFLRMGCANHYLNIQALNTEGTKAPGTAAGFSALGGAMYNSAGVNLTDGQQAALQADAKGILGSDIYYWGNSQTTAVQTGYGVSNSGVVRTNPAYEQTYWAANAFTPPATPTDMVTICGSASKTIKVVSFRITTTNTAAGSQQFGMVKRSTQDTTGTFVAGTAVPADSANAASTAAQVGHYTANPGALGTAVGTIALTKVASPVAVPATFAGINLEATFEMLPTVDHSLRSQPITLRGTAQCLALNFLGAALVAGQTHNYTLIWTEE